jgi:hypothetical protein
VAGGLGWVTFFPIAAAAAAIGGIFYIVLFNRIEDIVQEREQEELGEHEENREVAP